MNNISFRQLLLEKITWNPNPNKKGEYISDKYSKNVCCLRMNDFPDEPLWTLFCKGEMLDIEETPSKWKVYYTS